MRYIINDIIVVVLTIITTGLNAQQLLQEHQVGPGGMSSVFSFYNTTPESPDGSTLVYVRCKKEPYGREEFVPGELWVCDRDVKNHKKIADITGTVAHNGVEAQWIDNDRIVFFDKGLIRVVSAKYRKDLLKQKITCAGLGHYPYKEKILYNIYSGEGESDPGIYELDCNTFKTKSILTNAAIAKVSLPDNLPSDKIVPVKDWRALHCQYSPDGSKIAFRLDVGPFEEGQLQGICNSDGSGLKIMTQTLHSIWYDNESMIGHLRFEKNGKKPEDLKQRFTLVQVDLEGNILKHNITPRGNHLGVSPDRKWSASETFYQTDPVVFKLYQEGHSEKAITIATYKPYDIVWKRRFHVNPSFSRDGKRVYYSRPLNEKYAGIFYYEIK